MSETFRCGGGFRCDAHRSFNPFSVARILTCSTGDVVKFASVALKDEESRAKTRLFEIWRNCSLPKCSRRYSPELKSLCLEVFCCSKRAYEGERCCCFAVSS